ncbi:MAG TPA: transcription antitermination factor NusB [Phycisphaerae bacterium]|nr:transcription antitermination factor NusB [Phycisphaerae bacterium]
MVPPVTPPAPSARSAALEALRRARKTRTFLRDALHAVFEEIRLEPRDRALATQLAAGVVRHRRTLRLFVSHARGKGRRATTIQPDLLAILELGAFQLLFLDRVPDYAAVNEAAQAARCTARGKKSGDKAAGFANGVLRGVQRLIAGHEPDGLPAPDAVPNPDGGVVRLREAVLPDPREDRAAFLGAAYSYPDWLVARWLDAFGDVAEAICRWNNRRPRLFARANPMLPDTEALLQSLTAEATGADGLHAHPKQGGHATRELKSGWHAHAVSLREHATAPGPRPLCVDVSDLDPARLESLLADGSLTIQDPSAMLAVEALRPVPGEAVLDLCASPGTKTTQILEAMRGEGRIVACDRSPEKLQVLRRALRRYSGQALAARGAANVTISLAEDLAEAAPPNGFDAALVDAPCSNTGVLARRVEARWRLRPDDLEELPRWQLELLTLAASRVRPGGRLVYSTCSLEAEENEGVVRAFLEPHRPWRLAASEQLLPAADHDGAFWALLKNGVRNRFSKNGS